MEKMKEKIEIGLNEEGKIVVEADVKTLDFLKKAVRGIEIAVIDQFSKEGHNGNLKELLSKADNFMREALTDKKNG